MNPPVTSVLITGGRETGGLTSFAEALRDGFAELGIPAAVIPPSKILNHWKALRDPSVLKILSTTAVFAAPFARRALCVAHGFPRPDAQGWINTLAILASLTIANLSRGCRLVAVSEYVATHLRAVYNFRVDAVVLNTVLPLFCEPWVEEEPRNLITYVGRLVSVKNVHRMLPAIFQVLEQRPDLRACIIGDGPQRQELEALAHTLGPRIDFVGALPPVRVRALLRKTRVFVSGNPTEPLGITYLEALSQGCAVAMPACGGGVEIALGSIGSSVGLMPLSFDQDEIANVIHRLLASSYPKRQLPYEHSYRAVNAASAYLAGMEEMGSWPA